MEAPRSSLTAEMGFGVANDSCPGCLKEGRERTWAGIAKGPPRIFWTSWGFSLSAQGSASPAVDKLMDLDGVIAACNFRDLGGSPGTAFLQQGS